MSYYQEASETDKARGHRPSPCVTAKEEPPLSQVMGSFISTTHSLSALLCVPSWPAVWAPLPQWILTGWSSSSEIATIIYLCAAFSVNLSSQDPVWHQERGEGQWGWGPRSAGSVLSTQHSLPIPDGVNATALGVGQKKKSDGNCFISISR